MYTEARLGFQYIDYICFSYTYYHSLTYTSFFCFQFRSLPITSTTVNHTVLHLCVLSPSQSHAVCTEMLRDTGDGKQDALQKLKQWDKVPIQTQIAVLAFLACWQTGTRRLNSSPFHRFSMPPSRAREDPFPSGQPRGKEAGNVADFGALLWVCVSAY